MSLQERSNKLTSYYKQELQRRTELFIENKSLIDYLIKIRNQSEDSSELFTKQIESLDNDLEKLELFCIQDSEKQLLS